MIKKGKLLESKRYYSKSIVELKTSHKNYLYLKSQFKIESCGIFILR